MAARRALASRWRCHRRSSSAGWLEIGGPDYRRAAPGTRGDFIGALVISTRHHRRGINAVAGTLDIGGDAGSIGPAFIGRYCRLSASIKAALSIDFREINGQEHYGCEERRYLFHPI